MARYKFYIAFVFVFVSFNGHGTDGRTVGRSAAKHNAFCGLLLHHSILSSPVPRIFSAKLHRIPINFVLAQ